jgi:hypothetical protein
MLDAMKTIFETLAACVEKLEQQYGRQHKVQQSMTSIVETRVKHASTLLKTAKDRLIAEADDIVQDKGLGPVVTPEAIIIMLLDRLSRGVYDDGTADIMDLYEKIVEKIVRCYL